jgi:hypothetical protein
MKTQASASLKILPQRLRPGFALVVTLSLMILLTVVAVGLLTLSSISLRATSQESAMTTARDNARLALQLALGELQRSAGPDQRITAPASLVDASASPAVTGVWESWSPSPEEGSPDYNSRKTRQQSTPELADGEFVAWLASRNPLQPAPPNSPPNLAGPTKDTVTLISERKLPSQSVRGVHLIPTSVNAKGAMAWNVADEGVKARLDLAADEVMADADQRRSRLRAPARPQVETIDATTAGLRVNAENAAKLISISQGDLHLGGKRELQPYLHDLTPYSASLPVNVVGGGIKADLTRAFETQDLPAELRHRHIYSNTQTRYAESDPKFVTLAEHYKLYKKNNNLLTLSVPAGYLPSRKVSGRDVPNLAPHDGTLVAPVVTRVSVAFTLVSRPAHANWPGSILNITKDSQRTHMIYLVYTPVVTVYNPYSSPLQFSNLRVTFRNLPVAFKFFRNGLPQTVNPTLLSTLHIKSQDTNGWDDPFTLTISNRAGVANSPVILYPGEARVFGESHSENTTWSSMTNFLWNTELDTSLTRNVFAGPGWDYRSGYIVDWLRPNIGVRTEDNGSLGVIGVRPTDTVNVEVSPVMPGGAAGRFTVDFSARIGSRDTNIGFYEYQYGTEKRLKEILERGNHTTVGKISYPFRHERGWNVDSMRIPDGGINTWGSRPKQFAIFTLGVRTAHDSLYPGKPGKDSSFAHHVLSMDARQNHPALMPMEMSLLPVTTSAGASTIGSIDADNTDRAFHFSGGTSGNGLLQFITQNIPASPLMNLADLRHANLASSGHLPLTPATVGESHASPMVPSDKAKSGSSFGYEVVDHAWLANRSLWDAYYFSGIRNANDAKLLFSNQPLPLNPRQSSLLRSGMTFAEAEAAVLAPEAWSDSAAMMAVKGGFNVNSTSKSAWTAVLNSLLGLEVPVRGPVSVAISAAADKEVLRTAAGAIFPRTSRPVSDAVNASNSRDNQRRWSGFRELSAQEIDKLADAIVAEVRARGPFLSMAEFVNRRLGSASDEMAAFGALESAIRKSGVNNIPMGDANRFLTESEATAFGYPNPKAAAGNTEEGASALITQGDLLSAIGASVTVRSDTFVIRAYGDSRQGGRITARAWCEAVVQRVPAFVDPADSPEKVQAALVSAGRAQSDLSATNRRYGRRFEVTSFRWLSADEV